jgi:integrase
LYLLPISVASRHQASPRCARVSVATALPRQDPLGEFGDPLAGPSQFTGDVATELKPMKRTLTDRFLKSVPAALKGRHTDYADGIVPGLAVRVSSTGQKSFVLVSRFPGKNNPTRRALGSYPAMTIDKARTRAREWLDLIQRGIDPSVQVASEVETNLRRQKNTFRAVAESFIEKHVGSRRTAIPIKQLIERKLIVPWGDRPVDTIGKRDVIELVESVRQASGVESARQTLIYVRRLFGWAAARDLVPQSPCLAIAVADLLPPKVSRDRVLSDGELRLILKATADDGIGYPTAPFARLLLLTAARRGEVAEATWPEIDMRGATWLLPPARVKNASEHTIPLSAAAVSLLGSLPRYNGGEYLFSTTFGGRPISGFSKLKLRLDRRIAKLNDGQPLADWTWHDLRRTAASGMSRLGIPPHIIEAVLNHRSGIIRGVARAYNRHDFRTEKATALATWAAYLDQLERGQPTSNVVRLAS